MEISSVSSAVMNVNPGVNSSSVCKAYTQTANLVKGHGDAVINNTSDFNEFGSFLKTNYADRLNSGHNMVSNAMRIMREDSTAISILSKQKDNSLMLFALALAALNDKDEDKDNTLKALLVAGILGMTQNKQMDMFFSSQQMQVASSTIQSVTNTSGSAQSSI